MNPKELNPLLLISVCLLVGLRSTSVIGYLLDEAEEVDELPNDFESFQDLSTGLFHELRVNESWPDQSVYDNLGQLTSIAAADPDGDVVYVLHRHNRTFDASTFDMSNRLKLDYQTPIKGSVLAKIVAGEYKTGFLKNQLYLPHGLTRDHEGNFWIADVGSHQVYKFDNSLTELLMTLGTNLEPGSDEKHFCKPTHVAVSTRGYFFVADGYCNRRIMKFYPNGTLFKQWDKIVIDDDTDADGLESDTFDVPHQLTLVEDSDLICVADRENNRALCFTAGLNSDDPADTGILRFQIASDHPVYGIAHHNGLLFLLVFPRDEAKKTHVLIYDILRRETISLIGNDEEAFRESHHLATCPADQDDEQAYLPRSCLLVVSTALPREIDSPSRMLGQWGNRMWKFDL